MGHIVNKDKLPEAWPTNRIPGNFWEQLGRTIATYGFLEEILTRAIFALSATKAFPESEIEEKYKKWLPYLETTLSDQLWNLIEKFSKHARAHQGFNIENFQDLIDNLESSVDIRNILCHGSWPPLSPDGESVPFFVHKRNGVNTTKIGVEFLLQTQRAVSNLAAEVINTVTHMGLQFPGSNGPGEPIWNT